MIYDVSCILNIQQMIMGVTNLIVCWNNFLTWQVTVASGYRSVKKKSIPNIKQTILRHSPPTLINTFSLGLDILMNLMKQS